MGGDFFKLVYNNNNQMLYDIGIHTVVQFNQLEADDIIAILKNHIRNLNDKTDIYIITNDHDYLQLMDENTKLFNLQFKNLLDNKKVFPEADKNLFYKIVLGDKSDNIPPILSGCGPKTTEKYYLDRDLFETALKKQNVYNKYILNKTLVSFSEIPNELVNGFLDTFKEIFDNL